MTGRSRQLACCATMDADMPFGATAVADTVIRSSDDIYLYVLGALLRYVSPVFRDLFSLNRGPSDSENETRNGYPVIPLPEDSDSIINLLRIIYPCIDKPKLDGSLVFMKVGEMAEKYGMDAVVKKLKKWLNRDYWMGKQPHRAFAIAAFLGWDEEMIAATKKLESWGHIPYCQEFQVISGADYYRLLEYRFGRGRELPGNEKDSSDSQSADCNSRLVAGKVICDAAEPFHSSVKADVILRSSDSVDFHASRTLLQLVSPNFEELFANPKEKESKNGLDVISVTEDSGALRYFLLMVYHHIDEPPMDNLESFANLCMIARKYGLSSIEARLKKQLATSPLLTDQPFRVYAITTVLRWSDVAAVAAKNTLNTPLQDAVTRVPELNRITGTELYRLVEYRTRCANAAYEVIKKSSSHQIFSPSRLLSYTFERSPGKANHVCSLLKENPALLGSKVEELLAACPRGAGYANAFTSEFLTFAQQRSGHYLKVSSAHGAFGCYKEMTGAIEEAVAKVLSCY
ncbi:hypothetical protein AX15_001633 [Amanita polypyramis BW_CC]|nr:hypothetical protein AX15_001633 [Amanita polypyramis BW_CC]